MPRGTLPVIELFGPTVQGEGFLAGRVSHFIRFGGCPYRCSWCDSLHAVLPEEIKKTVKHMPVDSIVEAINELGPAPYITLTGGDPVMWDLTELIGSDLKHKYKFAVETEGALWKDWLRACAHVTLSPKGPSSGMDIKMNWDMLDRYLNELGPIPTYWRATQLSVKIPIEYQNLEDLKFAKDVFQFCFKLATDKGFKQLKTYLSVVTKQPPDWGAGAKNDILKSYAWLLDQVKADPELHHATVLPQLHVLAWGPGRGI